MQAEYVVVLSGDDTPDDNPGDNCMGYWMTAQTHDVKIRKLQSCFDDIMAQRERQYGEFKPALSLDDAHHYLKKSNGDVNHALHLALHATFPTVSTPCADAACPYMVLCCPCGVACDVC